jgi:D-beta-D-heptose 7-phosphate kinase/D-beta-D-heptose 1-phosphate adenosyltransferase
MIDFLKSGNRLEKFKVLVIGDLMLDHYIYGNSKRLSPEAPVPVVVFEKEDYMLGGCGNLFRNLNAFNLECGLISVIGDDYSGKIITTELNKLNIETTSLFVSERRPSTVKKRIISRNQQIVRVDTEETEDLSDLEEKMLINQFCSEYLNYNLVIISDYSKGVVSNNFSSMIIEKCNQNGIKVFVDPKKQDFFSYSNASLIKPNLAEAELAYGKRIDSLELVKDAANFIKSKFSIGTVVITLGSKGIFYSSDTSELIPGIDVSISDVSGAGDTVMASLALGECFGLKMNESVIFANTAASIVVQKFGSSVTNIKDVLKHINNE